MKTTPTRNALDESAGEVVEAFAGANTDAVLAVLEHLVAGHDD